MHKNEPSPIQIYQNCFHIQWLNGDTFHAKFQLDWRSSWVQKTTNFEFCWLMYPLLLTQQVPNLACDGRSIVHSCMPNFTLISSSCQLWGTKISKFDRIFYCASYALRGICHGHVFVCLSVCPSVTSRCSTKMAKHRNTQITPHDSPWTLVLWCHKSFRNSNGVTHNEGAKCG